MIDPPPETIDQVPPEGEPIKAFVCPSVIELVDVVLLAGVGHSTLTVMFLELEQPLLSVAVTLYVPDIFVVTEFESRISPPALPLPEKLFGPIQEYEDKLFGFVES